MGLEAGTPVIGGMGDVPAAATGSGALEDGDAHIYLGTSGWLCISTSQGQEPGQERHRLRGLRRPGHVHHDRGDGDGRRLPEVVRRELRHRGGDGEGPAGGRRDGHLPHPRRGGGEGASRVRSGCSSPHGCSGSAPRSPTPPCAPPSSTSPSSTSASTCCAPSTRAWPTTAAGWSTRWARRALTAAPCAPSAAAPAATCGCR